MRVTSRVRRPWRYWRMARGFWGVGVQRSSAGDWYVTLGTYLLSNEPGTRGRALRNRKGTGDKTSR